MNQSDNFEGNLNCLIGLFQQLKDLGDFPSEEWEIGIVFVSLPQSYSTIVTALVAKRSQ